MNNEIARQIGARLKAAESILVTAHVRPDGDAIASMLAMGMALQKAGKRVQMALTDGVPSSFRHLPGAELVTSKLGPPVDLVVALDCAARERVGAPIPADAVIGVNIDHHASNTLFGEINLIDPDAVSTTAMLAEHFPAWGLLITPLVAKSLLSGVITDTQGFRTYNMTSRALRLAADLMDQGADLPELYFKSLIRKSFEAAKFWGAGLSKLEREDNMVWTTLTLADRQETGYPGRDDAELIAQLATIDGGVDISLVFIEQGGDKVKVSWRAQEGFDVSKVAAQFGGGGHVAAAGAMVEGTMDEVKEKVLQTTRALAGKELAPTR